jgi:hypothetical protein
MIIGVAAQQLAPADSAPLGRFAPSLRAAAELGAVGRPAVQLTGGQKWTRQPVIRLRGLPFC